MTQEDHCDLGSLLSQKIAKQVLVKNPLLLLMQPLL